MYRYIKKMAVVLLLCLILTVVTCFNPNRARTTPRQDGEARRVYKESGLVRSKILSDSLQSDEPGNASPVTGKKQAFEVLSGSKKQNDYAHQAVFTLLSCHGGLDLESSSPMAKGVVLGESSKVMDLLYHCDVEDNELREREWHDILEHCIRLGYSEYSIKIFYRMKSLGLDLSVHTITEMLKCACAAGHYDEALAVFDTSIAYGMEPTVHNFSPLLKSCGSVGKARELLQRMEHCGISPNVISYTAAIKSCEPSGNLESVLAIMELMRSCGVEPNEVTYCCVISVASKGMQGTLAVNMLREMESNGLPPNQLCYGSALTACARSNMWREVNMLLLEMEARGLPLQESVLISVINVCRISQIRAISEREKQPVQYQPRGTANTEGVNSTRGSSSKSEVDYLWRHAVGLALKWGSKVQNATESVYTMAMDVCETAGKNREIINLFRIMLSRGVHASKSSYLFALRACARGQNIREAVLVLNEAEHMGMDAPFMYNSTLMLCESLGRFDVAVGIMRQMMAPSPRDDAVPFRRRKRPVSTLRADAGVQVKGSNIGGSGGSRLYHGSMVHAGSQTRSSSFVSFHASLKQSKWRNSVLWTARRIISKALTSLTRGFNSIFTEVRGGRLRPNKENAQFVNDLTSLLCDSIHERYGGLQLTNSNQLRLNAGYLLSSCYPMANKLLLDSEDYPALRILLNSTLGPGPGPDSGHNNGNGYAPPSSNTNEVNSTRLYDFAVKSLIPFMQLSSSSGDTAKNSNGNGKRVGPSPKAMRSLKNNVEVVASLISDVREAGHMELATALLLKGISRLRLVPVGKASGSGSGSGPGTARATGGDLSPSSSTKLRDRHFMDAPASPVSPKIIRDLYHTDKDHLSADEQVVKARLRLVCFLVLAVRKRAGPGFIPRQAYHMAALAAKQTHSHTLMFEICRLAEQEHSADINKSLDTSIQQYALSCLCRSSDHWEYALQMFDRLRFASTSASAGKSIPADGDKGKGKKEDSRTFAIDRYAYSYALTACETGKDWRRALELIAGMSDVASDGGVQPNEVLLGQAISVCGAAKQTDEAMSLFEKMQRGHFAGVQPVTLTYCKVIQALQVAGRWREALQVYEQAQSSTATATAAAQSGEVSPEISVGVEREGEESEVSLFTPSSMDNVWLHRAMLECLADANQEILVDEIYRQVLLEQESTPLRPFIKLRDAATVDLHFHSVSMARSAMRCCFGDMLKDYDEWLVYLRSRGASPSPSPSKGTSDNSPTAPGSAENMILRSTGGDERRGGGEAGAGAVTGTGQRNVARLPAVLRRGGRTDPRGRDYISIVVGKGDKLSQALASQLAQEFNPPLRIHAHPTNPGRLIIPNSEALAWLRAHSSVYRHGGRGRGRSGAEAGSVRVRRTPRERVHDGRQRGGGGGGGGGVMSPMSWSLGREARKKTM